MRTKIFLTLLAMGWIWVCGAAAQDAQLIQAARKEGKVVWHTSLALPSSTAIAHYFQNKYKGIEVEVHRNGSQRVLQRFMQEASAGIKNADLDSYFGCRQLRTFEGQRDAAEIYPPGRRRFSRRF